MHTFPGRNPVFEKKKITSNNGEYDILFHCNFISGCSQRNFVLNFKNATLQIEDSRQPLTCQFGN